MKKYFVVSDIHGYYIPFISALKEAGFDKENEEHILIVLGDVFDRGPDPLGIYHYLTSFKEDRLILVKGNHEYLLEKLIYRRMPLPHDNHNGTYQTLISLYKDPYEEEMKWLKENYGKYEDRAKLIHDSEMVYRSYEQELYDNETINEIMDWIRSPKWHHYYELGKYIFVHAFIPLDNSTGYIPNWRETSDGTLWYSATWGCPYELYEKGFFKEEERKGKILVCGHWHTADFYNHLLYKNEPSKWLDMHESNPIFISDKYPGLIGIDACTAATKKVNVLVINEEDL